MADLKAVCRRPPFPCQPPPLCRLALQLDLAVDSRQLAGQPAGDRSILSFKGCLISCPRSCVVCMRPRQAERNACGFCACATGHGVHCNGVRPGGRRHHGGVRRLAAGGPWVQEDERRRRRRRRRVCWRVRLNAQTAAPSLAARRIAGSCYETDRMVGAGAAAAKKRNNRAGCVHSVWLAARVSTTRAMAALASQCNASSTSCVINFHATKNARPGYAAPRTAAPASHRAPRRLRGSCSTGLG